MEHFDEPKDEDETKALEEFQKLFDEDLVAVLEDDKGQPTGFRLQLIIPIPTDPKNLGGSKMSQLKFGMLTVGGLIDSDKKSGNTAQQLKLVSDLTAIPEKVLRSLNPKDFQNAGVVAYLPFTGPRFLPVGRS